MRKIFLLLMVLVLFSSGCLYAVDWQSVDTDRPNLSLYVDRDSVKNINPGEYLYAVRYRIGYRPEQVAYIKSNFNNNNIGVIQAGLFDENEYRPQAVFANPRVFMKPVSQESFLTIAHRWVSNSIPQIAKEPKQNLKNEKLNQDKKKTTVKENSSQKNVTVEKSVKNVNAMKEFVAVSGKKIQENWYPPKSGRNTNAILIVEIGPDGSLQNYRFAKSSGDKLTDRSIMSAVELSSPFKEISNIKSNTRNIDVQFVFEYKFFRKSVI